MSVISASPTTAELLALEFHLFSHRGNALQVAESLMLDAASQIADSPALKTFCAGGVAGAVSRTCTAPLDRLKTLAQEGRVTHFFSHHPTVMARSRAPCAFKRLAIMARHVYHTEGGLPAFWKGNGVNCMKAGPEHATAFMMRQVYVSAICRDAANPTFAENFLVGALAGTTAQALLYPMEVVKTRMAVSRNSEYNGVLDCLVQSIRRGGIRDVYRGLAANTCGIFPHRGLEMGLFFTLDQLSQQSFGVPPPLHVTLAIGFTASLFAQVVTYPLSLARTRLQTQGVNGRPVLYKGLTDCLSQVVMQDGVRGLFVGLLPNCLKAVPASMMMYVTFRRVQYHLDSYSSNRGGKNITS